MILSTPLLDHLKKKQKNPKSKECVRVPEFFAVAMGAVASAHRRGVLAFLFFLSSLFLKMSHGRWALTVKYLFIKSLFLKFTILQLVGKWLVQRAQDVLDGSLMCGDMACPVSPGRVR